MTVWVMHPDKKLDLTQALQFGDIEYINTRYVYADELTSDNHLPTDVVNKMLKAVDEFDPDKDFMLIAGDHLQLVAMSAFLMDRWGWFQVLRYDREAQGYLPVTIGSTNGYEPE